MSHLERKAESSSNIGTASALDSEYYFAYLAQLTSFVVLAVSNIVLPNFLGGDDLYKFNESMGTSLITFSLTGDGILFIAVNYANRAAGRSRAFFFSRLTIEHFLLATTLSVPVFFAIHPVRDRDLANFVVVLGTTGLVTLYNSVLFYCAATFQNRSVALLALWNGLLYLTVPVVFHAEGIPVFWAPPVCFGLSLVPAVGLIWPSLIRLRTYRVRSRPAALLQHRIIRIREVLALSAGKSFKMLALWGPVLFLGSLGNTAAANNNRITLSLMEGVGALVPYPRNAMLSLLREESFAGSGTPARAVEFSIFAATLGALGVVTFGGMLIRYVFLAQYGGVEQMLRHAFPYLPLSIIAMILANSLTAEDRIYSLAVAYICSAVLGIALLYFNGSVVLSLILSYTLLVAWLWMRAGTRSRRMFANTLPGLAAFILGGVAVFVTHSVAVQALVVLAFAGTFFFLHPVGKEIRLRYQPSPSFRSKRRDATARSTQKDFEKGD